MSKGLEKKLNHLESKLLGPITDESIAFSYYALSEPEQKLFDAINNLTKRDPESFTEYEHKLLITAFERQTERMLRMFLLYARIVICKDDPLAFAIFLGWFGWFMEQAKQGIWQRLREDEIYNQKGKTWKQKEREADEFYKKHWKHNLFSEESFKKSVEQWAKTALSKGEKKHG